MRIGEQEVDAFEFGAIGPRGGGELEHRVELDRPLRIWPFAYEPRPHRIVKLRVDIPGHAFLPNSVGSKPERRGLSGFASQPHLSRSIVLVCAVTKISKAESLAWRCSPKQMPLDQLPLAQWEALR